MRHAGGEFDYLSILYNERLDQIDLVAIFDLYNVSDTMIGICPSAQTQCADDHITKVLVVGPVASTDTGRDSQQGAIELRRHRLRTIAIQHRPARRRIDRSILLYLQRLERLLPACFLSQNHERRRITYHFAVNGNIRNDRSRATGERFQRR